MRKRLGATRLATSIPVEVMASVALEVWTVVPGGGVVFGGPRQLVEGDEGEFVVRADLFTLVALAAEGTEE